jgi:tRNA1(Val) A37 N6-methylase TrmN6
MHSALASTGRLNLPCCLGFGLCFWGRKGSRRRADTARSPPANRARASPIRDETKTHLDGDLEEALLALEDVLLGGGQAAQVHRDGALEQVGLELHHVAVEREVLGRVVDAVEELVVCVFVVQREREGERERAG